MKVALTILFLAASATASNAWPVAPLTSDSGMIIQVRGKGGSSRSAVSGRFVTRSYASNKSTTVTHGKY